MSINAQESQEPATVPAKPDKEDSLVQIRKMYEKEREARAIAEAQKQEYERLLAEKTKRVAEDEDDDDDSEPYVDKKKLNKTLNQFGQKAKQEVQQEIKQAVNQAINEERRTNWMKQNPDFYEVMQHAQKFAEKDPELAEAILDMPDTFERQKLVYKNIKALGVHKKDEPQTSIQDKINQNQRSPGYQPSGVASAPYGTFVTTGKDYSDQEQRQAFDKMKALQKKLRLHG